MNALSEGWAHGTNTDLIYPQLLHARLRMRSMVNPNVVRQMPQKGTMSLKERSGLPALRHRKGGKVRERRLEGASSPRTLGGLPRSGQACSRLARPALVAG